MGLLSMSYTVDNNFKILNNQVVNSTVAETCNNLISKENKLFRMLCIAACNSNQECVSVVYDKRSGLVENCFLYNRSFNSSEITQSSTSIIFEKEHTSAFSSLPIGSFLFIFTNPINTMMFNNNPAIQGCVNVEKATINNIEYNLVIDLPVGVHLYDCNWNYQSTFNMASINYGCVANSYYYFTDASNGDRIIKTTFTSPTVLKSYGGGYRGLYHDSIDSRIIAAGCDTNSVDTFDLDLNFNSSVSFPGQCPHGVTVFNTKIYVAIYNNNYNVAVISNGVIENTYLTQCSSYLVRISVDSFGYFALSCENGQAYLYDSNMQYTSKSIGIGAWVGNVNFDTNNRLAVCGWTNVNIYN